MLILRTVQLAPAHGHTIAHCIERTSDDVLQVEHGSLYPALHRPRSVNCSLHSGERPKIIAKPSTIASRREGGSTWNSSAGAGTD
ncbi:MAG TPA: helix-turn-helix transcriptional regulator [Bryobacteraceae bacterium]